MNMGGTMTIVIRGYNTSPLILGVGDSGYKNSIDSTVHLPGFAVDFLPRDAIGLHRAVQLNKSS